MAGPRGRTPSAGGGERPRVLVVDDNADMRDYIASLLASRYDVETAADGAIALELARREPPELVVTDVMMPNLDGFGLLAALQADPATTDVPVIMVSARAGEEGTIEGLEAGADDYLIKPFAARELLARVHANLELDRARRTRDALRRSGDLLDQAQRLARVGSWEIDLATSEVRASPELLRQLQLQRRASCGRSRSRRARPPRRRRSRARPRSPPRPEGEPLDIELRIVTPDGATRLYRTLGELERDEDGSPVRLRGSNQDITEQREAEHALAAASIADELQRSLLPELTFDAEQLEVATYYRAGVAGTQVGGDWYDVIDLGAGRTALVLGDVVGRGVRAAAVMGQLRAAVRAYAQLELSPADVLECLDEVVRHLGPEQIVTCLYAVFDPRDRSLTYANAGHLPPLLALPGEARGPARRRRRPAARHRCRPARASSRETLRAGALLAIYTDGLVERRDRVIDDGIDRLAEALGAASGDVAALVDALVPDGSDDDIALLTARVLEAPSERTARYDVDSRPRRDPVRARVRDRDPRGVGPAGRPASRRAADRRRARHQRRPAREAADRAAAAPAPTYLLIEVEDGAAATPRKLRPTPTDDHGRGLQLTAAVAGRWGTRPLHDRKTVWCQLPLARYGVTPERAPRTAPR